MWKLYELWFWQRVTFLDGTKSKRGATVMKRDREFRPLTPDEAASRDKDDFEERASSF